MKATKASTKPKTKATKKDATAVPRTTEEKNTTKATKAAKTAVHRRSHGEERHEGHNSGEDRH